VENGKIAVQCGLSFYPAPNRVVIWLRLWFWVEIFDVTFIRIIYIMYNVLIFFDSGIKYISIW